MKKSTILLVIIVFTIMVTTRALAQTCGNNQPLDCSVPWYVMLPLPHQALAKAWFHSACVKHDYCYRHGNCSYAQSRLDCDRSFLNDMTDICLENNILNRIVVPHTLGTSRQVCLEIAAEVYAGVRAGGASSFKTGASCTVCDYRGSTHWVAFPEDTNSYVLSYSSTRGHETIYSVSNEGDLRSVGLLQPGGNWDIIVPYQASSGSYLLWYDQATGKGQIHKVTAGGDPSTIAYRTTPGGGWDKIISYDVAGNSYLLWYDRNQGNGMIHRIQPDGSYMRVHTISPGGNWDLVLTYNFGLQPFVLFYSRSAGTVRIHPIAANGGLGSFVSGNPGGGWDQIVPYTIQGRTYLLWYASNTGQVKIHLVASNGGYGTPVHVTQPGGGWRIFAYTMGSQPFLGFSGVNNGKLDLYKVSGNGGYAPF